MPNAAPKPTKAIVLEVLRSIFPANILVPNVCQTFINGLLTSSHILRPKTYLVWVNKRIPTMCDQSTKNDFCDWAWLPSTSAATSPQRSGGLPELTLQTSFSATSTLPVLQKRASSSRTEIRSTVLASKQYLFRPILASASQAVWSALMATLVTGRLPHSRRVGEITWSTLRMVGWQRESQRCQRKFKLVSFGILLVLGLLGLL